MQTLIHRAWVPELCEEYVQSVAGKTSNLPSIEIAEWIKALASQNRDIHEKQCFNLNPATNVMNPKAEALLASGMGSRPSLGYPGDKYEMGLEAVQEVEIIAAELCAEVFDATYAEIRVASGAMANLYGFMATCKPGDSIIAPPATIGGHVTHHSAGCAGLYGLKTYPAPVDVDGYSVDLDVLRAFAQKEKPKLITIGGSLNLFSHPVEEIRMIADEIGAWVLFDAAHQCGIIAGKSWPNPLQQGAHLMTMSTYKSLGGPAGGLIVTNESEIAEKLDAIAFPGMTANFDVAKSAALAITMLDWREHGSAYAEMMVRTAKKFAAELSFQGIPVYLEKRGYTESHQFAVEAARYGGGQTASKKLRQAGFLSCGIGLPCPAVENDMNGLRIGTPELVRWGVAEDSVKEIAGLVADALNTEDPQSIAPKTKSLRAQYNRLHYILD